RPTGTATCATDPAMNMTSSGNGRVTKWPSSWKPRSTSESSGTRASRTNATQANRTQTATPRTYFHRSHRSEARASTVQTSAGGRGRVSGGGSGEVFGRDLVQELAELLDLLLLVVPDDD